MNNIISYNNKGAKDRSPNYDTFVTEAILEDICFRLTNDKTYCVEKNDSERNVGRLIKLKDTKNKKIYFINLSQEGVIKGRNYYFQSISTALEKFFDEKVDREYDKQFCFYFMPFEGNIKTDYYIFLFRIMETAGIKFVNKDSVFNNHESTTFTAMRDLINERNILKQSNAGNQSTYISDDGDSYGIYGKTFGTNVKETILLCLAAINISEKQIKLYQILDNDSESIGEKDKMLINEFSKQSKINNIEIIDDTLEFEEKCNANNLRSPRFNYNLLNKYGGIKKCAICGCEIEQIIQGAHIYPVAEIRKNQTLSNEQKYNYATHKDNGMWLCENHHKLFDSGVMSFVKNKVVFNDIKKKSDEEFLKEITKYKELSNEIYNSEMEKFFKLRYNYI